jgi:hypothetical protein
VKEKPKPTRQVIPLDRLRFDLRLQMRSLVAEDGTRCPYDVKYVQELIEARENGAAFPPLEVVEEANYKGKKDTAYWVFDGFSRGAMYQKLELPSVDCMVYPGTWLDAKRWALRANDSHGRGRRPEDCRRVFEQLMSDDAIREDVVAGAKSEGGIYRALQGATGLSQGAIGNYLKEFGWRVTRMGNGPSSLTKVTEPAPIKPLTIKEEAEVEGVSVRTLNRKHAKQRETTDRGPEPVPILGGYIPPQTPSPGPDDSMNIAADDLERTRKLMAAVSRSVERLLASPLRDSLIRHAAAHGVRISKLERLPDAIPIGEGVTMTEIWNWEAVRAINAALNDVHNGMIAASLDHATLA